MTRRPLQLAALVLIGASTLAAPPAVMARKPVPSRIVIGDGSARAGRTAIVPVLLRDQWGTPLGTDRPAGARIGAFSLKVIAVPARAVKAISVRRAGAAAGLQPLFEARPAAADGACLLVTFDERRYPFALGRSAAGSRLKIAEIVVELAPTATPGTRIELRLDPATTLLGNQAGTISESATNGWLELHDGSLRVAR